MFCTVVNLFIYLKILLIFRKRGMEGEREEEKHQSVVASRIPSTGDLARNPGTDWEVRPLMVRRQALGPLNHTR